MTIHEDYKEALRAFIERSATPVVIDKHCTTEIWDSYSIYGWQNRDIESHAKECGGIVAPKGIQIREVMISQVEDYFADNSETVGINAWGGEKDSATAIHCVCGKYSGMMIRWTGSLYDAMQGVLGLDDQRSITI